MSTSQRYNGHCLSTYRSKRTRAWKVRLEDQIRYCVSKCSSREVPREPVRTLARRIYTETHINSDVFSKVALLRTRLWFCFACCSWKDTWVYNSLRLSRAKNSNFWTHRVFPAESPALTLIQTVCFVVFIYIMSFPERALTYCSCVLKAWAHFNKYP